MTATTAPKTSAVLNTREIEETVVALRKLALQYDTKLKYALDEEDEEQTHLVRGAIKFNLALLKKLGDTKPLAFKTYKVRQTATPKVEVSTEKPKPKRKYTKSGQYAKKTATK
jgi:hypothetical protein